MDLHNAYLVITDSGGLQEEATGAGTPVLVLRDTTERPEGIEPGIARLVDPSHHALIRPPAGSWSMRRYEQMRATPCPYGDGHAARRIVEALAGHPTSHESAHHNHIYERPLPEHPLDARCAMRRPACHVVTRTKS